MSTPTTPRAVMRIPLSCFAGNCPVGSDRFVPFPVICGGTIARMTPYDLTAAALVLLFAYGGYRRGLIGFTLHLAGSVLAFVLAALLAPALVTPLARAAHLP